MAETILIYYPPHKRSNSMETLACEFAALGHTVLLLTHEKKGPLHEALEKNNIHVHAFPICKGNPTLYYLKHLRYLIKFCKINNVTAIQSHLQQSNIIAVFAQYFLKARVVTYRHHLFEDNKNSKFFDKVIDRFAAQIVAPSSVIYNHIIQMEGVKSEKVKLIPYVYDFSKFTSSFAKVNEIRATYPAKLLVLLCGRFVPLKRNDLAIRAVAELVKQNKDVKLLALDSGPGLEACKKIVQEEGLDKQVFFIGYAPNVLDYMAACDVLIHPSYTEASNNTVKEAAIFSKKIIACSEVGDFSDYIVNGENGYLVDKENPFPQIINCLNEIYEGRSSEKMGEKLKETVYRRFNKSAATINEHLNLLIK